jgi:hypothetical protein
MGSLVYSQEFTTNPSSELTELHYVHIHFTDPTFVPIQLNMQQVTNVHKTTHTEFIKGHINMCKNIK